MRCDARTYLIDDILQKVDRASMASSLEARTPLLDPDVVALAHALAASRPRRRPARSRCCGTRCGSRLPDELVDRPKMGFAVPIGEWMRDGLRPLVEDLVLGRRGRRVRRRRRTRPCAAHHLAGAARRGAAGLEPARLRALATALARRSAARLSRRRVARPVELRAQAVRERRGGRERRGPAGRRRVRAGVAHVAVALGLTGARRAAARELRRSARAPGDARSASRRRCCRRPPTASVPRRGGAAWRRRRRRRR